MNDEELIDEILGVCAGFGGIDDDAAKEIVNLVRNNEWVSVKDRLPIDAKPVIIEGGCGHYSHKYNGWFTNMERDNFGEYRPIQWKVTHWMPMPNPPNENQND